MNGLSASVYFVTANYDLHCTLPIRFARALDMFNDHTTRFLELEHVHFYQHGIDETILKFSKTLLVKDKVHLALLVSEDRSSENRVFFATRGKRTMQVVLSLPTVMLKGMIHLKSATDLQGFLSLEAASFFPVTNATVLGHRSAALPVESPVALVKKDVVSSVTLLRDE